MALSADRNTEQMGSGIPKLMTYPVKTGVTIYKGSLVVVDSSGYAKPGVSETGDVAVGRAMSQVVAGAAASGTYTIDVEQGVFRWAVNGTAVDITKINSLVYVYDDQTVTLSSSSASIAGTVYGFDAAGNAWVYTGLAAPVDSSSVTTISNTLSTLKSNLVVPYSVSLILSSATTGAVVGQWLPHMSGTIAFFDAQVINQAVTTASKSMNFTVSIAGTAISGGALALISSTTGTIGNMISGTAVAGLNSFIPSNLITITAASGAAFTEGQVMLRLFLQSV